MLSKRENEQLHASVRYMMGVQHNGHPHVKEEGVHKLIDLYTSPNQIPHLVYCNNTSCANNTGNACCHDHVIFDWSSGIPQCLTYKRKGEKVEPSNNDDQ
jgi:hypothetical protein